MTSEELLAGSKPVYVFDLVGAVLFYFLIGSVAFYLMLVLGVLSYHHYREMLGDGKKS